MNVGARLAFDDFISLSKCYDSTLIEWGLRMVRRGANASSETARDSR